MDYSGYGRCVNFYMPAMNVLSSYYLCNDCETKKAGNYIYIYIYMCVCVCLFVLVCMAPLQTHTQKKQNHTQTKGTSVATPVAGGMLANILFVHPTYTRQQLLNKALSNTRRITNCPGNGNDCKAPIYECDQS